MVLIVPFLAACSPANGGQPTTAKFAIPACDVENVVPLTDEQTIAIVCSGDSAGITLVDTRTGKTSSIGGVRATALGPRTAAVMPDGSLIWFGSFSDDASVADVDAHFGLQRTFKDGPNWKTVLLDARSVFDGGKSWPNESYVSTSFACAAWQYPDGVYVYDYNVAEKYFIKSGQLRVLLGCARDEDGQVISLYRSPQVKPGNAQAEVESGIVVNKLSYVTTSGVERSTMEYGDTHLFPRN